MNVFEVDGDTVKILGGNPVSTKMFKNLDAALDFCRFAEPESMSIERIYQGVANGVHEVVGYQLTYTGSKGDR